MPISPARRLRSTAAITRASRLLGSAEARRGRRGVDGGARRETGGIPQGSGAAASRGSGARPAAIRNEPSTCSTTSQTRKLAAPEDVLVRLGLAAEAAGNRSKALDAFRRVYYEFPLSTQAADAQAGIERLQTPALVPSDLFKLELTRAERLFSARRWAQARAGFVPLANVAVDDDKELIALRLAECDYYLDRFRASSDALRPFLDKASTRGRGALLLSHRRPRARRQRHLRRARARAGCRSSRRILGRRDAQQPRLALHHRRRRCRGRPGVPGAVSPLSRRDATPSGRRGRSAGRRTRTDGSAKRRNCSKRPPRHFRAPTTGPRGCTGRRGRAIRWGRRVVANARYQIVASDYLNSYYGRLASRILASRDEPPVLQIGALRARGRDAGLPWCRTTPVIRALVARGPVPRMR